MSHRLLRPWAWVALGLFCSAVGGSLPAQEPPADAASPSPQHIELDILQLVPPVDQARADSLTAAIAALDDPAEQQRLQQLLTARLEKIATWVTPDSSDDAIQQRLEALSLGTPPTDATQDARDELLSAIVGMTDEQRRDRFLEQLKARERAAGTLIEAPRSSP